MSNYLKKLIEAPRVSSLTTNRAGDAVLTVNTITKDGKKYRSQLFAIADSGQELDTPLALTAVENNAKVAALSESGALYITYDKEIDGAESTNTKGVWKLGKRGEPQLVLTYPGGIGELQARPQQDGRERLIFTATVVGKDQEAHLKVLDSREKTGASAVLYNGFPTRYWDQDRGLGSTGLFVFDGGEDAPTRITALPEGELEGFVACPGGNRVLVSMGSVLRGIHQRSSVYLVYLDGSAEPQLVAEADANNSYYSGAFSPDGVHAFVYRHRLWLPGQSLKVELLAFNTETGELTEQAADVDRWPDDVQWIDAKKFAFATDNLGAGAVFVGQLNGETYQLTENGTSHYSNLSFSGGELRVLRDSIQHSAEPIALNPETAEEISLPSPAKVLRASGRLEHLSTTAEDGTEIRSWLALPEQSKGKLPLVIFAHGGPWGSWNAWTYRWNPWVLTELGYAVLLPDPAISLGYGQHMLDRGGDAIGATPYTDIMALIDVASARDDIDGENAAFMGGSYGGYMTNWVAGHVGKRFKCYVTHASLYNMENMYFTTDNGMWHEWMYEHENSQRNTYSPHLYIDKVEAPVLVIHGDKDYRVPIGEGLALWAALNRHSSHLEHKYLYYPDEGHWVLKPENSRIWYQTVAAWLNQHLLGKDFEAPENLGYTE